MERRAETVCIIRPSHKEGPALVTAPPDLATCAECLAEINDPADPPLPLPFHQLHALRPALYHHHGLPYDRPATTMAGFALCPDCARGIRTIRATGGFTPSPLPARTAGRA